jgi:hypothetical protein
MTRDDFRPLALCLPESSETTEDGVAKFLVRGRAFARLGPRDNGWAEVLLPKDVAELAAGGEPELFAPLRGTWRRPGFTQLNLTKCGEHTVQSALAAAWRHVAPRRLAKTHPAN